MTTPGGGDNEITFVTRVVSGGDEGRVARQVGEEAARAYRAGVESGPPVRLPAFDTSQADAEVSRHLDHVERERAAMRQRLAAADDRAAASLIRQAQERAYGSYEPNLQAGGRGGSNGGPPRPPLGTPDEFNDAADENFYRRALQARREMALAAREEASAQQLIAAAQERAFRTYGDNVHATARREHFTSGAGAEEYSRLSGAQRDEAAYRRASGTTIGQLGAQGLAVESRDNAYAEAQAVRRAMGEQATVLRTVTYTARDVAPAAARLTEAAQAAATTLTAAQARLAAIPSVPHRVGDQLNAGQIDEYGRRSVLGGTTTVRTEDGLATVAANGRLKALSDTEALTRAERELATATEGAATAARVEVRALHDLSDAELRVVQAQQRLVAAQQKGDQGQIAGALVQSRRAVRELQAEETGNARGLGGFIQGGVRGLTMARGEGGDNNAFLRMRAENGEFLGAIARYQAAYAVIFGLSQAFSAMIAAEVQAQDQMVEFSHATETSGEQAAKLANEMGRIGGQAGFSVAQSMQAATRGLYAFQNQATTDDSRADIGRESVRQAAAIRLIAPTLDPNQAQQQLIAATNGFNLGFEGQARVLDAAYNAMQNYGGAVEETIAALPTLSQVADQAGLSVEEMANLVSVAVSRTAMNGTGVASLLNRTFGNLNAKPQVRNMLEEAGIDASGSAGQVLQNLASGWDNLSKAQQNAIMAQLGGHEVARALLPILNEGDKLLDANAKSYERVGSAAELVREKQANIAGTLRAVQGELQNFGRALVDTGMFDLIGGAVQLLTPFLQGINDILRLFTLLPGESERWAFRLAEVLVILNLIGRAQARNLAEQTAQNAATGTQLALETGIAGAEGAQGGLLRRGATGARNTAGAAVGGAATLLTGVSGAVIGFGALVIGIGMSVSALRRHADATEEARKAVLGDEATGTQAFGDARTPEEMRAVASRLGQAAQRQAEANSGIFGGMFAGREDRDRAEDLLALSKYASSQATRLAQGQDDIGSGSRWGAFFGNSGNAADDLARGIQSMTQAGVPAVEMLNNVAAALHNVNTNATPAEEGLYYNDQNVSNLAQAAAGAVQRFRVGYDDVVPDYSFATNNPLAAGAGAMPDLGAMDERLQTFNPKVVQDAINKALTAANVTPGEVVDEPTQDRLVQAVLDNLGVTDMLSPDARTRLQNAVRDALDGAITESSASPLSNIVTETDYNRLILGEGETPGILQGITSSNVGNDPRKLGSNQAVQQGRVNALRQLMKTANQNGFDGPGARAVQDALANAEHELVESQIARMERLRQAALVGVTDPVEIAKIEQNSTIEQARAAINAGDETALLDVMNRASNAALDAVKAMLEKAARVAQAAYEAASRITMPDNVDPSDRRLYAAAGNIRSQDERAALDKATADLEAFDRTRKERVPSGSKAQADEVDPTALEISRINAGARAGDPVSQARAARDAAKVTLNAAQNETERNNARKALADANRQYTEAVAQQAQAAAMNSRPGDEMGAARDRIDAARIALQAAVPGTAEWFNAKNALAQAQYDYGQTALAVSNARDAAMRVRPGNDLASATEGLAAARRDLAAAVPNTVAYWNAYGALQQQEYAYAQAVMEAHHQRRTRSIDITDPLAQANEELRVANERVAYVKRTGNGNLDQEINNQRSAQARAESTAFDQRLSDIEHAHNMGTMSDQAYLAFLNSESRRLHNIANRTRQQTEQMQQMDQAIKAAADAMQGQWNLGDIRIPTPYEARRFIERSGQGAEYQQGAQISNTQTNHISFAGLTRQEVEAILRDVLGASATQRTATTARKV